VIWVNLDFEGQGKKYKLSRLVCLVDRLLCEDGACCLCRAIAGVVRQKFFPGSIEFILSKVVYGVELPGMQN
jgi:hypothetical protein